MGLFSRKFKEPVRGTATVADATDCPVHARSAPCRLSLVVSLPGEPATPVEFPLTVRADKWPQPGMVLPIEVDLAKPSHMRILWDEVPSAAMRPVQAREDQRPGSGRSTDGVMGVPPQAPA